MDCTDNMTKREISKILKNELDKNRYEHTLGVAYTASCLAMRYDVDSTKAYMAGLLHDCAKGMSDKERLTYCKKNKIEVSDVELENPSLLHAKAGAYMACNRFETDDDEICDAIRFHTTGRAGMSLFEMIVFVADYIEPNREHDPELSVIRKEAFDNIEKATLHIYKNTLEYLSKSTKALDPTTKEAYTYYSERA